MIAHLTRFINLIDIFKFINVYSKHRGEQNYILGVRISEGSDWRGCTVLCSVYKHLHMDMECSPSTHTTLIVTNTAIASTIEPV